MQLFNRLSSTSVKYLYTSRLISSIFDSKLLSLCHTFARILHTHTEGVGKRDLAKSSAVLVKFCAVSNMLMASAGLRNRWSVVQGVAMCTCDSFSFSMVRRFVWGAGKPWPWLRSAHQQLVHRVMAPQGVAPFLLIVTIKAVNARMVDDLHG